MSSSLTKLHSSLISASAVPTPTAVIATLSSSSTTPSSTFSTPPLSSPSQSSNGSSDQGGGDPASSGALYLYTFLATLVLLLSVSSAIVVRSLILRRRNGRLIAEAIANGTWFQNPTAPPPVGEKPALFEAFVAGSKGENPEKNSGEKEVDWQDIMPFSATYVHPHSDKTEDGKSNMTSTGTAPPNITTSTPRRIATFASALRRVAPRTPTALLPPPVSARTASPPSPFSPSPPNGAATPAAPTPSPPSPGLPIDPPSSSSSSTLRVAVLIARPAPPQAPAPSGSRSAYGEEEEDIPHVEFGVAEVDVVNEAREQSS